MRKIGEHFPDINVFYLLTCYKFKFIFNKRICFGGFFFVVFGVLHDSHQQLTQQKPSHEFTTNFVCHSDKSWATTFIKLIDKTGSK